MATMYDGANAATVPAGADVYAGYVDGRYQTYQPLVDKYPDAQHVSICVFARNDAQVLDVETGDAKAAEAPAWLARQRARGQVRPTIYCSRLGDGTTTGWTAVKNAIAAAGMEPPDYWIADQTGTSHGLDGAVAVQFIDVQDRYDESLITDETWPGGSAPAATTRHAPAKAANPAPQPAPSHAADPAPTGEWPYVVQPGDTLSGIAAKMGTTVAAIAKLSGIDQNATIQTGQTLNVPRT